MSKKKKEMDELAPIIRGLKVDVDRTGIEKELQARLENKQARIQELEKLTDSLRAKEGARVDREKWEREEQQRKDIASLKAQPSGGGKVPLYEPNKGFSSAQEMIDDLYDRKEAGDQNAEYNIQDLWKLTRSGLTEMMKEGFSISACPRCEHGILEGVTICPNCSFNLQDSGYLSFGEMWNR